MYTRVAEKWLRDQPGLRPLQREFLQEALAFYQEFARQRGDDPDCADRAGHALRRVGDIQGTLNMRQQTEPIRLQVIDRLNGLADRHLDNPRRREELAGVQCQLARFYRVDGRTTEAARHYNQALEKDRAWRSSIPIESTTRSGRRDVCWVWGRHGGTRAIWTKPSDFMSCAGQILEPLAMRPEAGAEATRGLKDVYHNLGDLHSAAGRGAGAESCWRRAVGLSAQLLKDSPMTPEFKHAHASDMCGLAGALNSRGRRERRRRCSAKPFVSRSHWWPIFPREWIPGIPCQLPASAW